MAEIFAVRQS